MPIEARLQRVWDEHRLTLAGAVSLGDVWQMPDGRAAFSKATKASGDNGYFQSSGKVTLPMASSIALLAGGRAYWDHSAGEVTWRKVNDRDFYLGRVVSDVTGGNVDVDLNIDPPYDIDALRDACLVVPVGTQAVGGFGFPKILGGAQSLELTATNEAQKIDLLSVDGFAKTAKPIIEMIFRVADDGAGTAADFNIGIGNNTHATDADAITEHLLFHLDANNSTINAQSKDTVVTNAAASTTKTYTEGSAVANRVECWIDLRTESDARLYINAVEVLPSTAWNMSNATGPFFLLAHLEKTSSTDVYRVILDALRTRYMEQA